MVGTGDAERLLWRQHKRQERDMGRQCACRGTYLNNPPRDCEHNPGEECVLRQFLGVKRAARGWGRSENFVLWRGIFHGGGRIGLRLPVYHDVGG